MILGFQDQYFDFHYETLVNQKKMLGININNKINFKSHIINISTVANQKLSALCRISNYIDSDKCNLIANAFVILILILPSYLDVLYTRV